jgi:heme exporter protein C
MKMHIIFKVLCVVLLLYVAVFAFLTPLSPALLSTDLQAITPGNHRFELVGYNTHFASSGTQQLFLINDSTTSIPCTILATPDDSHIQAEVNLPETIHSKAFAFVLNNNTDGTVFLETPIKVTDFTIDEAIAKSKMPQFQKGDAQFFNYPYQPIIMETIRNLMWHVPMWFTMFVLMIISFAQSIRVLMKGQRGGDEAALEMQPDLVRPMDNKASMSAAVGLVFCILGLITGSIWARFTWGTWWTKDPQLNGALVVFIVYAAYFILRNSVLQEENKWKLSAIYNIFAFVLMVVLLMILPRFTSGLHPGKSGNPAFSQYDLDSSLRTIFYPATLGFILLGYWLYHLRLRMLKFEQNHENISA